MTHEEILDLLVEIEENLASAFENMSEVKHQLFRRESGNDICNDAEYITQQIQDLNEDFVCFKNDIEDFFEE